MTKESLKKDILGCLGCLSVLALLGGLIYGVWLSNDRWGWITGEEEFGIVYWAHPHLDNPGKMLVGVYPGRSLDWERIGKDGRYATYVFFECHPFTMNGVVNDIHIGDEIRVSYIYSDVIRGSKMLRYKILKCPHKPVSK